MLLKEDDECEEFKCWSILLVTRLRDIASPNLITLKHTLSTPDDGSKGCDVKSPQDAVTILNMSMDQERTNKRLN
jgi:hypothetical protein